MINGALRCGITATAVYGTTSFALRCINSFCDSISLKTGEKIAKTAFVAGAALQFYAIATGSTRLDRIFSIVLNGHLASRAMGDAIYTMVAMKGNCDNPFTVQKISDIMSALAFAVGANNKFIRFI